MQRVVYSGNLKLSGEENEHTLMAVLNYASTLEHGLQRFKEAKSLLRRKLPVALRVLGTSHDITLKIRWSYARALYKDDGATLDDLRMAVILLEVTLRNARRVLGGSHPTTAGIEKSLREARAAFR